MIPTFFCLVCAGISSSMNFDEEEDDEDEISSSSSQLNSNTRPGSATSKKSCKVQVHSTHLYSAQCVFILSNRCLLPMNNQKKKKRGLNFVAQPDFYLKIYLRFMAKVIDHFGFM